MGNACGCVPVVDEQNKPVGILTDRDICMAAYTQGKLLADMHAESAVARKPEYAANRMMRSAPQ